LEGKGVVYFRDSLHIFRSPDWEDALACALKFGRSHEEVYLNAAGENVEWRLKEVLTLDQLPTSELDGVEVYSRLIETSAWERKGTEDFRPEDSIPSQTI
jgi:hypothetical protein